MTFLTVTLATSAHQKSYYVQLITATFHNINFVVNSKGTRPRL